MEEFKIAPGGKEIAIRKARKLAVYIVLALLCCLGATVYSVTSLKDNVVFWVCAVAAGAVFWAISVKKNKKRMVKILSGYRLYLGEDFIKREQPECKIAFIPIEDVKAVERIKNGSLIVHSRSGKETIVVPYLLEDFDKVEGILAAISPIIEIPRRAFWEKLIWPLSFSAVAAFVAIFLSEDPRIVTPAGVWFIGLAIAWLYQVQINNNFSRKVKSTSWSTLMLILVVVARIFLCLMN